MSIPRALALLAASLLVSAVARAQGASLFEVRVTAATPSVESLRVPWGADTLVLEEKPVLSDPDFTLVEPIQMRSRFHLRFAVTDEASVRLHQATCSARGRRLVFLLEGRVVNALQIIDGIRGGGVVEIRVPPADVPRLTSMIRFQWNDPGRATTRGAVRQPCQA